MPRPDVIDLLEAAYALDSDDVAWRKDLARNASSLLDHGFGAFVWSFDQNDLAGSVRDARLLAGATPGIEDLLAIFPRFPPAIIQKAMLTPDPGVSSSSEGMLDGRGFDQVAPFDAIAKRHGFRDFFGVRCTTPSGHGCLVGALTPDLFRPPPRLRERWRRLAAHITAAMRLRHATGDLAGRVDAILSPDGRILHAEGHALTRREALRAHALRVEHARTRRVRARGDEALEIWRVLADARWSLVDRFERDGRRYVIARRNEVCADPRGLSVRESSVAALLAGGHTNKAIGYELGIAEGTVGSVVSALARKLSVGTRAELVELLRMRGDRFDASVDGVHLELLGGEKPRRAALALLSAAQRDVATEAACGRSSADIARRRGCSVRTVENLLSAAYKRLGVSSRAELVVRLTPQTD